MQDSAIAGACAGLASSILTCPLDVVKTQLQAQGASATGQAISQNRPHGPGDNIRLLVTQIWARDGLKGFYYGLGPTILGYLPTWAVYFALYDQAKRQLINPNLGLNVQLSGHVMSALLAGAATTTITSPVWVVKTRVMLQALPRPGQVPYRNTWDAFVRIYRSEGITAFYKGLVPSLFGTSHVAVQFPLYDNLKSLIIRLDHEDSNDPPSPQDILACSVLSKMVASCLTYPHEVLRTRLQMQQHDRSDRLSFAKSAAATSTFQKPTSKKDKVGVVSMTRTIWQENGIRGFYKGLGINLLRTLPNSAMTLLTCVSSCAR